MGRKYLDFVSRMLSRAVTEIVPAAIKLQETSAATKFNQQKVLAKC
jgi:hypothetical protein